MISTLDAWPSINSWQQNQRIKLQRLKQQRLRMEKMKQVVQQYSGIIYELENKNKGLENQVERIKISNQQMDKCMIQNYTITQKYTKICEQLERQKKLRESYEITIDSLRKQLADIQLAKLYSPVTPMRMEIGNDYQVLQGLYEELKQEMYHLHTENFQLKQALKNQQSKNNYQGSVLQRNPYLKPGMIRVCSSTNLRGSQSPHPLLPKYSPHYPSNNQISHNSTNQTLKLNTFQKQLKSYIPNHHFHQNKKTINIEQQCYESQIQKLLRQQIKKQNDLIKIFKQNEEKQLNIIQSLKLQTSKICRCHKIGKSHRSNLSNKSKRQEMNSVNYEFCYK